MPPALLDSQFATLEEPRADEHAVVADVSGAVDAIVADIKHQLATPR
jgi:gluconate kinase